MEVRLGDLDGQVRRQLTKNVILLLANGKRLKLSGMRQDLNQALHLGALGEGSVEELNGRVADVVIGRDHAKVERADVHLILNGNAARLLQVAERRLNELGEVVRDEPVRDTSEVIVVRILSDASVEEGPGEEVDSVLLVGDVLGDNGGVEVVVEELVQVRLDGQRLVDELLEELLLARVGKNDGL